MAYTHAAPSVSDGLGHAKSIPFVSDFFTAVLVLLAAGLFVPVGAKAQHVIVETMSGKRDAGMQQGAGPDSLVSPDGRRFAAVTNQGSRKTVELDGRPGPAFSKILRMAFTADSSKLVYVGERGGQEILVTVDEAGSREGRGFQNVNYVLSPAGNGVLEHGSHPRDEKRQIKQTVTFNGMDCPVDGVMYFDPRHVVFSPDGKHCAYLVLRTRAETPGIQRAHLVIDGQAGPAYTPLFGQLGEKAVHFFTQVDGKDAVVLPFQYEEGNNVLLAQFFDGTHLTLPGQYLLGSLTASADRKHFAYVSRRQDDQPQFGQTQMGEYEIFLNGKSVAKHTALGGPWNYSAVTSISISPDGKRVAYAVEEKSQMVFSYIDGKKSDFDYASCRSFMFSPDGQRVAYVASSLNREEFVIVDGQEYGPYTGVRDLRFTQNGKHVLYAAGLYNDTKLAMDGQVFDLPVPAHEFRELSDGAVCIEAAAQDGYALLTIRDGATTRYPMEAPSFQSLDGRQTYFPFASDASGYPAAATPVDPARLQPITDVRQASQYEKNQLKTAMIDGHVVKVSSYYGNKPTVYVDGRPAVAVDYMHSDRVSLVAEGGGKVSLHAVREGVFTRITLALKPLAAMPVVPLSHAEMKLPTPEVRAKQPLPPLATAKATYVMAEWKDVDLLVPKKGAQATAAKSGLGAAATTSAPKPAAKPAFKPSAAAQNPGGVIPSSFPPALSVPSPTPAPAHPQVGEVAETAKAAGATAKDVAKGLSEMFKKKKKTEETK